MMRGAGGGTFSARAVVPGWSGATEESGAAVCLRSMIFFLSLTACFSILSMQRVSAWYMSAFVSFAVMVCSRQWSRISAMWRFFLTSMVKWGGGGGGGG